MHFRGNAFFSGLKILFFWICFWRCFWFGHFPSFWFSFRQLVRSVDSVGQFRPVCNAFGENAFNRNAFSASTFLPGLCTFELSTSYSSETLMQSSWKQKMALGRDMALIFCNISFGNEHQLEDLPYNLCAFRSQFLDLLPKLYVRNYTGLCDQELCWVKQIDCFGLV